MRGFSHFRAICARLPALLLAGLLACGTEQPREAATPGAAADSTAAPASELAAPTTVPSDSLDSLRFAGHQLPAGFERLAAYLLELPEAPEYTLMHVQGDTTEELWLCRNSGEHQSGAIVWVLSDRRVLPALASDEALILGLCKDKGEPDPAIAAVVRKTATPEWHDVQAAWRADVTQGRLLAIATEGITCVGETY